MTVQSREDEDTSATADALREEAKRLFVDSTYSGRGHQVAGARWLEIHNWLGVPASTATTILAGSAALSALLEWNTWVTAGLALIATIASAVSTFLRPKDKADEHTQKGNGFIAIRNQARLFKELDLRSGKSPDQRGDRLKRLRAEYDKLNQTPPLQIPRWAYEKARANIAAGESSYTNDPLWTEMED